jgi:hypothetical protein
MSRPSANDLPEAVELGRADDWRIKKLGGEDYLRMLIGFAKNTVGSP